MCPLQPQVSQFLFNFDKNDSKNCYPNNKIRITKFTKVIGIIIMALAGCSCKPSHPKWELSCIFFYSKVYWNTSRERRCPACSVVTGITTLSNLHYFVKNVFNKSAKFHYLLVFLCFFLFSIWNLVPKSSIIIKKICN